MSLLLLVLAAGCSKAPDGPKPVPVTGTITRNGQPLPEVDVMFVPESGQPSVGKTDSGGHFQLEYTADRTGAVPGKHRVVITLPGTKLPPPTGDEKMPAKIQPAQEFYKEAEVKPDSENDFTFEVAEKNRKRR